MCWIIRLFLYTFIIIHAVISIKATLGYCYYVMNKAIDMLEIRLVRSPPNGASISIDFLSQPFAK